jgi:hypothetical protein
LQEEEQDQVPRMGQHVNFKQRRGGDQQRRQKLPVRYAGFDRFGDKNRLGVNHVKDNPVGDEL